MSPDNHHHSPYIKRIIKSSSGLTAAFPHLGKLLLEDIETFRGLTMFIGDTADVVVGLRIFLDDGTPGLMWSSGENPLAALMNLDKAVSTGNFKVDKKALAASPPP